MKETPSKSGVVKVVPATDADAKNPRGTMALPGVRRGRRARPEQLGKRKDT